MKSAWESRDWNDTMPADRLTQLSPAECSVLEAIADGRKVTVIPHESTASGKPAVIFGYATGDYTPVGYLDGQMPHSRRVAYATYNSQRIEPDDLIASDDVHGWVVASAKIGIYTVQEWRGNGEVRLFWKDA